MDVPRRTVLVLGLGALVAAAAGLATLPDEESGLRDWVGTLGRWVRPSGEGYVRYEDLAGADLDTRLNAARTRAVVTLPAGTFEQADFARPTAAGPYALVLWATCGGLAGSGPDETFVQLRPGSSTKVADVPRQSTGFGGPASPGTTNPLKVLHAGETTPPDTGPRDVYLGGFTLRGTDQPAYTEVDAPPDPQTGRGHNYHGIELYRAGKVVVERLRVVGIPGSSSANPGETFSLLCGGGEHLDLRARAVEIDGRHPVTGRPIGGSGIYHGGLTPTSSLTDVDVHHMGFGWGLTHYDVHGGRSTYTRVRSRDNVGAFNWERCHDHTFELVQVDNRGCRATAGPGSGHDGQPIFAVVDSDQGSVTINLRDVAVDDGTGTLVPPSVQHPVLVVIHPGYWGNAQQQRPEDLHVFDAAGVEHPDWLVVLTGYQVDGRAQ